MMIKFAYIKLWLQVSKGLNCDAALQQRKEMETCALKYNLASLPPKWPLLLLTHYCKENFLGHIYRYIHFYFEQSLLHHLVVYEFCTLNHYHYFRSSSGYRTAEVGGSLVCKDNGRKRGSSCAR